MKNWFLNPIVQMLLCLLKLGKEKIFCTIRARININLIENFLYFHNPQPPSLMGGEGNFFKKIYALIFAYKIYNIISIIVYLFCSFKIKPKASSD